MPLLVHTRVQVRGEEHGVHAGKCSRRVDVDRQDPAPCDGATDEAGVEHGRTHDVVDVRAAALQQPVVFDPVHPTTRVAGEPRLDGRHLDPDVSLRLVAGTTLHTATRQRFVALSAVLVPLIALPRPIPPAPYPAVGTECQRDYGDAVVEGETLAGPPLDDLTDIGPLTLGGLLVDRCTRFADHEALVFDDPLQGGRTVRWTYGDLLRRSRSVAKSLLASGLGKGGRVGILMGNRPEAVASLFGAALAGAVAVPLSTFAPKPELSYLIAHADISVLLLQTTMDARRFADDVADLCPAAAGLAPFGDPQYPYLCHVAVLGPPEDAADLRSWDRLHRTRSGGRDR